MKSLAVPLRPDVNYGDLVTDGCLTGTVLSVKRGARQWWVEIRTEDGWGWSMPAERVRKLEAA